MNASLPEAGLAVIPAHSESQAMDWSLVLASQDIPSTIERLEEKRWVLAVESQDYDRALAAIRQYRLENRRWAWRQPLPWPDVIFHWGGLLWGWLMLVIFRLSAVDYPSIPSFAQMDSKAVSAGEWWRLFTATFLHGDLAHLFANAATGVVLLGLAMARYGAGCGLLAAYLAGAAGNLAGFLIYNGAYQGLGASGMVMGALGLLSMPNLPIRKMGGPATRHMIKSALAGVLLFVLLGTNAKSDVIAHLGGFVTGLFFGVVLQLLPHGIALRKRFSCGSWFVYLTLVLLSSWLALTHR
jgi:rhomboid protease GluP